MDCLGFGEGSAGLGLRPQLSYRGFRFSNAPLSNSWIINIIWLYIALNRTPNIDCYWGGGSTQGLGFRVPTKFNGVYVRFRV